MSSPSPPLSPTGSASSSLASSPDAKRQRRRRLMRGRASPSPDDDGRRPFPHRSESESESEVLNDHHPETEENLEEGEGDDLMENAELDYRQLDTLDHYDPGS